MIYTPDIHQTQNQIKIMCTTKSISDLEDIIGRKSNDVLIRENEETYEKILKEIHAWVIGQDKLCKTFHELKNVKFTKMQNGLQRKYKLQIS